MSEQSFTLIPYLTTSCGKDVQSRLEITDLQNDEKQWSLFIHGMAALQQSQYRPPAASWQELGGIHGVPYKRWPGDPKGAKEPEPNVPDQWLGYCRHNSILFPTWHRAAILLVERAMVEAAGKALDTASKGKISPAWQTALDNLRFPFWDWTLPKARTEGVPAIFQQHTVTVAWVNGSTVKFDPNPLMRFAFNRPVTIPSVNPQEESYFDNWSRTYRNPDSTTSDDPSNPNPPKEQYDAIAKAFAVGEELYIYNRYLDVSDWSVRRQQIANMFDIPVDDSANKNVNGPTYYSYFSNASQAPPDMQIVGDHIPPQNVEGSHNAVHLTVGGEYGHMSYNDLAGYDPIFWLHHCNVDRLYAFWEYVYADYWMDDGYINKANQKVPFMDSEGTYDKLWNKTVNQMTDLTPFRKTADEYWNSRDLHFLPNGPPGKEGVTKNYTYPPIRHKNVTITVGDWTKGTLSQREVYATALNEYFGSDPSTVVKEAIPIKVPFLGPQTSTVPANYVGIDGYRRFTIVAEIPQYAFAGSHRIVLYFDGVPVSNVAVLSRMETSKCGKCTANKSSNAKLRGVMHIPHEIIASMLYRSLRDVPETTEEEVVELIKRNISARVTSPGMKVAHAHAEHGLVTGARPSMRTRLEQERHTTFTLFSNAVARKEGNEPVMPSKPIDVRHHGSVLEGEWVLA